MAILRIHNRSMGGPVVHFTDMKTSEESAQPVGLDRFDAVYRAMQNRAMAIGGREHHNHSFGGGVSFYNKTPEKVFALVNSVNGNRFADYIIV